MNESGYTFSVDEYDRHSDFVYNILLATIQMDIILVSIVFIVILFTLLFYSQLTRHTLIILLMCKLQLSANFCRNDINK